MARRRFVVAAGAAVTVAFAVIPERGAAQPAVVPSPAPQGSVTVNEAAAPPLAKPTSILASWDALWRALPKSASDLRIALAEIERAEAATRVAWGAVLPSITGTATLSYSPPNPGRPFALAGGTLQAQLTATQTLVNVRAFHQIGTQHVLEEVAQLNALEVRRRLALNLARGAASIAAAARIAEGNRTSLELAIARLDLTKKRLAGGVGDARDLVRAQQDVAAARAVIAPADESYIQAQEGLATLLAIPGAVGLASTLEGLEAEVLAFCGPEGEGQGDVVRPDVAAAKKQVEVAERNVTDITLKFLPTVTAQASAGTFGRAFEGPFRPGFTVSANLTIPFYDGGVRYGERRDRLAVVEQAKARAIQAEVAATIEKAQARRAVDVAIAAQTAAKEARDLAAEAERLANVAYAGGVGTNFDLVDTGRRLREAEVQLVLRELDVARARLALPFVRGSCAGLVKGT